MQEHRWVIPSLTEPCFHEAGVRRITSAMLGLKGSGRACLHHAHRFKRRASFNAEPLR